jgi:hypothetical protein
MALGNDMKVEVVDGNQIPIHRLEVLANLIKRVALRKATRMMQEELMQRRAA